MNWHHFHHFPRTIFPAPFSPSRKKWTDTISSEEGQVVVGGEEDGGAVVAPVQGVVDQAVSDGTGLARHASKLTPGDRPRQEKNELTPFFLFKG
jgi:hypothetical protein